jgi:hypothetical protein
MDVRLIFSFKTEFFLIEELDVGFLKKKILKSTGLYHDTKAVW